jgi:valyl-tRNA synthetase
MNLTIDKIELPEESKLALEDKWILDRFSALCTSVSASLDKYEIGVALSSLYDFVWDIFCDWYIELSKTRLNAKDTPENLVAQNVISYVLVGTLKLLHPFMPFITEEIYQALPIAGDAESIMIADYPKATHAFPEQSVQMDRVIAAIRAIRARRNEMNVVPSRRAKVYIATKYTDSFNEATATFFTRLASASEVVAKESFDGILDMDGCVRIVTDSATIFLPMNEIIDLEKEIKKLEAEEARLTGEIERIEKKLANEGFVAKAPEAVVNAERQKKAKYEETLDGVRAALAKMKK